MKIMVDLDRTVFDCPSIAYYFGNISKGESNLQNDLKYIKVDEEKSRRYLNLLFFLKMSHAKNFTEVDKSVEILKKWHSQGIEFSFVSSRPNYKSFHKATVEWFESRGIDYADIIFSCNNKALYGKLNHFDMIVDDTLKNCLDCAKVGIMPIWIRTKYNETETNFPKDLLHTKSWDFVDSVVQQRVAEQQQIKVITPVQAEEVAVSNKGVFNAIPNSLDKTTEIECM